MLPSLLAEWTQAEPVWEAILNNLGWNNIVLVQGLVVTGRRQKPAYHLALLCAVPYGHYNLYLADMLDPSTPRHVVKRRGNVLLVDYLIHPEPAFLCPSERAQYYHLLKMLEPAKHG